VIAKDNGPHTYFKRPSLPHAMMMTSKKCRRGQKKEQWLSQRGQVNKMINYLPVKRRVTLEKGK